MEQHKLECASEPMDANANQKHSESVNQTKMLTGPDTTPVTATGGVATNVTKGRRRARWITLRQAAPLAFALGTLAIIGYALVERSLSVMVAYSTFGVTGLALVWRGGRNSIRLFFVLFGLGCTMLSIWMINHGAIPYYQGGSDDLEYEYYGQLFDNRFSVWEIHRYDLVSERVIGARHNSVGYIYIVGLLTKLGNFFGGFDTLLPRLFNVTVLSLLGVLVFRYLVKINIKSTIAVAAAVFCALMPGVTVIASYTFRDIIIAFIIFYIFYLWSFPKKHVPQILFRLIGTTALITVMSQFRFQTAALLVILLIAMYVINSRSTINRSVVLSIALAAIIIFYSWVEPYLYILSFDGISRYLVLYTELRAGHGSVTSKLWEVPFPLAIPVRLTAGLIYPYPGRAFSFENALALLNVMIHIFFLPCFFKGVLYSLSRNRKFTIIVGLILTFLPFALITGAPRNVPYYYPFFCILVAIGWQKHFPLRYYVKTINNSEKLK